MCGQALAPRGTRGAGEGTGRHHGTACRGGGGVEEGEGGGHAAIVGRMPARVGQCFFLTVFFAGADFFVPDVFFDGAAFVDLPAFTLPWLAFAEALLLPRAAFDAR